MARLAGWLAGLLAGWPAGRLAGWLAGFNMAASAASTIAPPTKRSLDQQWLQITWLWVVVGWFWGGRGQVLGLFWGVSGVVLQWFCGGSAIVAGEWGFIVGSGVVPRGSAEMYTQVCIAHKHKNPWED